MAAPPRHKEARLPKRGRSKTLTDPGILEMADRDVSISASFHICLQNLNHNELILDALTDPLDKMTDHTTCKLVCGQSLLVRYISALFCCLPSHTTSQRE